ncbi:MAG: hypothetical protein OXB95_11470 [Rhodobacteraceae bacterium]|nr:hypothetical protein [Paracoccaceae bacterium]
MILLTWVRGFSPLASPHLALDLAIMALAGIPLAIPVYQLWSWRRRLLTVALCLILVPLGIAAVLTGGLLGPVGILAFAAVCSLPAWGAMAIVCLLKRRSERETDA